MTARPAELLPADVAAALEELCQGLRAAAGANLRGVVLYGGLARGRYRRGVSDVNVLVLLRAADADAVTRIAPPLHDAWRAWRVEPFILTEEELSRAALLFPTKILDIQLHHLVLTGEHDLLGGVMVDREHVRLRIEQELRNLGLRMRRRLVAIRDDRIELAASAANAAAPLAANLAALLYLTETASVGGQRAPALFDRAADAFGLDRDALAAIRTARNAGPPGDMSPEMYARVLRTVLRAADAAADLEGRDGHP